jgi:hypothetical protein
MNAQDGHSEQSGTGLTITSGPDDVKITGNAAGIDMLVKALQKAIKHGSAAIEEDGRALVTVVCVRVWKPQ